MSKLRNALAVAVLAALAAASSAQAADIILVIDNSGSMEIEAASVKANMNKFSGKIIASGVDAHVVLISAIEGKNGMCIEPPLGGGGCPLADSKLPTFLHIDHKVGSFNALQKLLDRHADWKDQMRPDARKHIVVVSDDNSELWLSTDQSPANKVRIAHVPGWTSSRLWTKYPEQ